jgi:hypothetical protein
MQTNVLLLNKRHFFYKIKALTSRLALFYLKSLLENKKREYGYLVFLSLLSLSRKRG